MTRRSCPLRSIQSHGGRRGRRPPERRRHPAIILTVGMRRIPLSRGTELHRTRSRGNMLGILAATMASLGWGTDAVLARQGLRQIPPALGTCLSLCAGLVVCVVILLITDP